MTKIEWTEKSANPIRFRNHETGGVGHFCEKIAAGCTNCYAEALQFRFQNAIKYRSRDFEKGELFLEEKVLNDIEKRKKPTTYFLCDMTDMFGEWVPAWFFVRIFTTIDRCPQHTFQILTKRPERVPDFWPAHLLTRDDRFRSNVWLGTSVSDQTTWDKYVPRLLSCNGLCPVLFVSAEPLLGPIIPNWKMRVLEPALALGAPLPIADRAAKLARLSDQKVEKPR